MAINPKKLRQLAALEAAKSKGGKRAPSSDDDGDAGEEEDGDADDAQPSKEGKGKKKKHAAIVVMINPIEKASQQARKQLARQ